MGPYSGSCRTSPTRDNREAMLSQGGTPVGFCSMCGPKFCSMRISHDIRDQAKAGMARKAAEFRDSGSEIYVPETRNS